MHRNIFSPNIQSDSRDSLSSFFHNSAQTALVVFFGLLPLFFVPNLFTSLGFIKAFFLILGSYVSLILVALSILRSGKLRVYMPLALVLFWVFSLFSVASALLSGDIHDSLYGVSFDVNSAGFFVLMAIIMTLSMTLSGSKKSYSRFFVISIVVAVLVYLVYLLRLIFGPQVLSFGIFNSNFVSTVGSLNDLALYSGLVLVVVLVVVHKLPDRLWVKILSAVLVITSLVIAAIANFSFVWLIVGFISLLTFLYLVAKDTWLKSSSEDITTPEVSKFVLSIVAIICLVSGAFIVSGDYLGGKVSEMTGVTYLEVRPSLDATLDIARNVYKDNILFGVGPNRFEDAWRQYKDSSINVTQFWNTNFSSGNGFATTLFVTTGLIGAIMFIVFILAFLQLGYKMLFSGKINDEKWSFVGMVSFVAASYLWLMTFIYTPGSFVMLLTAIMTGLTFAVWSNVRLDVGSTINVAYSKQHGFLLIASALVIIVSATALFVNVNKQFLAQVIFTDAAVAFNSSGDISKYDNALIKSIEYNSSQDLYVAERARLRLAELNRLLAIAEPSEADQQLFQSALVEGISLAETTIATDPTNPINYALLASFYGLINPSQYEGVGERRNSVFAKARELDPSNPEYLVLQAQLSSRFGETEKAREYLNEAIALKGNYTDALFLLSQLDISEGNATSAIATTKAIISIEPYNPGRYYQLGLLLLATNSLAEAAAAFEAAITLDTNYANARYMLALTYLDMARVADALTQLKIVEVSNQDNQELLALISRIEEGDLTSPGFGTAVPVKDSQTASQDGEATVSVEAPDTNLVTPVNRVPRIENSESEVIPTEEVGSETEGEVSQ